MRKIGFLFVLFVVIALFSTTLVDARKGVGIKWDLNTLIVQEGKPVCVDYGVYNPWDEDVNIALELGPELSSVITDTTFSEPKLVKAYTSSQDAVPVTLCFKTENVYEKDCVFGPFLCAQKCSGPEKSYEGEVVAVEVKNATVQGAFGSSTSIGVSTKLKLKVSCTPFSRDWTVVFGVLFVIAILIVVYALRRRRLSKKGEENVVISRP